MRLRVATALMLAAGLTRTEAQGMGDLSAGLRRAAGRREYLSYVAEPAAVAAGKLSVVELHLRVADGYHVNSHVPKSELLIPTTVTLQPADSGTKIGTVEYPAGVRYSFATDPGEVLDVYAGAVVLRVPVTATAGEHALSGTLRYQACDQKACYPPKTITLSVPFTAR